MKSSSKYSILGSGNQIYKFDSFTKECDCQNYKFRNQQCKHQLSHLVNFKDNYYIKIFRKFKLDENEKIHIINLNNMKCESCQNNCNEIKYLVEFFLKLNSEANNKKRRILRTEHKTNLFFDIWDKIYYNNNMYLKNIINNLLFFYYHKYLHK